jgi:hypothetical protein
MNIDLVEISLLQNKVKIGAKNAILKIIGPKSQVSET